MPPLAFVGPTYAGRSPNIDASRCVNFFPELSPSADHKTFAALVGTPGTVLRASLPRSPVRALHVFNGVRYAVGGDGLFSLDAADAVSGVLGTLGTTEGPVSICDNGVSGAGSVGGNQLLLCDGLRKYVYNVVTGAFTAVAGASDVATFLDGYFVANIAGTMSYQVSDLYDGTTWNALASSPVGSSPDPLKAVASLAQQLVLIKRQTAEVWYDAGIPTSQGSPFLRVSGAVLDVGTAAPASVARGDNSLFWLAQQRTGDSEALAGAVQLSGYQAVPITPPGIVWRWGQYTRQDDALGWCQAVDGHTFYWLTFPTAGATWVYDATTKMWHERSSHRSPYAVGRHLANCYTAWDGRHYVGDYQSGRILELRGDAYTDAGDPIVSVRTTPHQFDRGDLRNFTVRRLVVDHEAAVGNAACLNPQAYLSWSVDGGHVFGNEYPAAMGKAGEYAARLVWRKLGYAPDRVWRLLISDPVKRVILGAHWE